MTALPRRALPAALALALAACSGSKPGPAPATCLPGCAGTRGYDALAYALTGRFDWATGRLIASEAITLSLPAGAGTVVDLDAAVEITSVTGGGRALPYAAAGGALRVDLGALSPGTAPVTFTVEYTAALSDALRAPAPRAEDPVRARVVFTDSEPDRGHQWLVEKDDPADRARFSVTLTVADDEDLVANGERTADAAVAGGRRVSYALDTPIPTYLMAFAAGQLTRVDRPAGGGVPLSLWHRRGLAIAPSDALDQLADAMATFEALLGPYPYSRYSLVLLPSYGGGMENATASFESEQASQGPYGFNLHAHELAHQWFGDQVTMHRYEDVWFKEGMATLLAAEAARAWSDLESRGRLLGSSFAFQETDAIVDPSLTGLARYTSGPYERAAALITQLRARLGEATFWARLRAFLADHAHGSATGEQFVRAFAPALSEAEIQQVLGVLPQRALPGFDAAFSGAGPDQVALTLSDPGRVLLAPYPITVVDAAGAATPHQLTPGVPLLLDLPAGGYLAPDEGEVHPDSPVAASLFSVLTPYLRPPPGTAPDQRFLSASPAHQERALAWAGIPALAATEFPRFYDALDSEQATVLALQRACSLLRLQVGEVRTAWADVLRPIFDAPRFPRPRAAFGRCGPEVGAAFAAELQALADGATPAQLGRLEYLVWLDQGADGFAPLSQLATAGPTLKLRDAALWRLAYQASGIYYAPAPAEQDAAWRDLFRGRLAGCDAYAGMSPAWFGVVGLADVGALPEAGAALQRVALPGWYQEQVVCQASGLAAGDAAAWASFQAAAQPWSALSPGAATLLGDPAGCAALGFSVKASRAPAATPLEGEAPPHRLEAKGGGHPATR
jgi:hypothetical protein